MLSCVTVTRKRGLMTMLIIMMSMFAVLKLLVVQESWMARTSVSRAWRTIDRKSIRYPGKRDSGRLFSMF